MAKLIGTYTSKLLVQVIEMQRDAQERLAFARIAHEAQQITDDDLAKYEKQLESEAT